VFDWLIREEVRKLGEYIVNNPTKWTQTHCTFNSKEISIWTGNGVFFVDSYPNTGMFGICEKFYILRCINTAKLKRAVLGG
jgi:hypothetical protein